MVCLDFKKNLQGPVPVMYEKTKGKSDGPVIEKQFALTKNKGT